MSLSDKINQLAIFHKNNQIMKTYDDAKKEYDLLKSKDAKVLLVKIVGTSFYTSVFYSKQMIEKKLFKIYELC
jgi:hypothetical protein